MTSLNIKVTIEGPGGVIDNEAMLIRDLLVSKGANVTMLNDTPSQVTEPWRDCQNMNVTLSVKGLPWGG